MIYYVMLAIVLGCAMMIPPQEQKKRLGLLMAVVAFIGLVCALRDMLGGYDNYIYGEIFDATARDIRIGVNPLYSTAMNWEHSEKGYAIYNVLIAFLTSNRYVFFFITAVIFYVALFFYLKRYTKYPFMALAVFLALFYFFSWVYIRQTLAVMVATAAIPFAVERKPVHFFATVTAAVLFHSGAVMFAPVYFIANKHFTRNQLIMIGFAGFLLGLTPLGAVLVNMFGSPVSESKSEATVGGMGGVRLAYMIEAFFFAFLVLFRSKKLKLDKYGICMLNITVMFVMTLLTFVRFENGGRLTWCYLIGVSCFVPEVLVQSGKETWIKYATYAVMALLYIRILNAWAFQLSPYKTFLTNGVRAYDPVYEQYEYDENYEKDKFYKW